ncbi:MAG: S49 family peptidase [Alphaproteobacteria bacterium]|nr:S49 family peptidase [Alphaproteobacteria bacterium]
MSNYKKSNCLITKFFKKIFCCKKTPRVACLNLHGVIGKDSKLEAGLNMQNVEPLLERAFEMKRVKAVALAVNSPGGSPVQSELIYNYVRELSTEKKIPVYTFAQDVAASGGYWLLLAGDEIYAHNSSIIGSIGVIFSGFGFVDLIKKIGVDRRVHAEGKNKAILDPFLPEDLESVEILKNAQRDIFESFKELVKSRRGNRLKKPKEKLFTGAFWSGKKAVELGLVDAVADLRSKMKEKFGDDVEIVNISTKKSFLKSLLTEKLNLAESLLDKLEERVSFGRFGL